MKSTYFRSLYNEMIRKSSEATLGVLRIKHIGLRKHLKNCFHSDSNGNMIADPVFEATFPWERSEKTFQDLAAEDFLHPSLVNALDNPGVIRDLDREIDLHDQELKKDWFPYTHQIAAWTHLKDPNMVKSIVVTSGTGSGKTECFMIPVMDDLIRQSESQGNGKLFGVQALFIYPMNALINSQRERLLAWTKPFQDKIRFCLYNGNTDQEIKKEILAQKPRNEVHDRKSLWNSPPPILITNPTMLEYMLIRNIDRPILTASKGKLKWVILDEAHTYIGSQAAELALLLRRTLYAFGVEPKDVRFVATSATIGNDREAIDRLKKYLSDLAGVELNQVEVVGGRRYVPELPQPKEETANHMNDPDQILAVRSHKSRRDAMLNSPTALKLRESLAAGPQAMSSIMKTLFGTSPKIDQTLKWIDLASDPDLVDEHGTHYLPLRGHFFHRVVSQFWACINPNCPEKKGTALEHGWEFGMVYTSQVKVCACNAIVLELVFCNQCNASHLIGVEQGAQIKQEDSYQPDEFSLLTQEEDPEDPDIEKSYGYGKEIITSLKQSKFVKAISEHFVNSRGEYGSLGENTVSIFHYNDRDGLTCSHCGNNSKRETFKHAYLGMPFFTSNTVPILLEHAPAGKDKFNNPCQGKSLITFTDSRQGSARIAIKMQRDAMLTRTRGLIAHYVLRAVIDQQKINEVHRAIQALESVREHPGIAAVLNAKQNEMDKLMNSEIGWEELRKELSNHPDVSVHMRGYLNELTGDKISETEIAELLLAGEFGRRPKNGNSLEMLGMICVSYNGLETIVDIPNIWKQWGLNVNDWRDLLKLILDYYVREGIFVSITNEQVLRLGGKYFQKYLLPPNSDIPEGQSNHRVWLQYREDRQLKFQHRIVRLIALATRKKPLDGGKLSRSDSDEIDEILKSAWKSLTAHKLLVSKASYGFQLLLSSMNFRRVTKVFLCPISMRLLDTTLVGYSPYMFKDDEMNVSKCEIVRIPVLPQSTNHDNQNKLEDLRKWLSEDEAIMALRERGLWTDQNDQFLEGGFFFRTAEHSAQIDPKILQAYERKFKEGKLNVLSCSTTMEMGVDIGGLSSVFNNNVPPHPSNYLQRAGRAGRRGESRALSVTLCSKSTLEQQIFNNPIWPFVAKMKQPNITLSSDRIVQRHINSYLFSYFLNQIFVPDGNPIKLNCIWFFMDGNGLIGVSVCGRFKQWIENQKESLEDEVLSGINLIVRNSGLEDQLPIQFLSSSIEKLESIEAQWLRESQYFLAELAEFDALPEKDQNRSYRDRLLHQQRRLNNEFLFSQLVIGDFLPSFGFPVGIATFDPTNSKDDQRQREEEKKQQAEGKFRKLPSRNLALAIAEYAPGSEVVMDGRVYKSQGLSLNWHLNPDAEINETQLLQDAWRCANCGSSGVFSLGQPKICRVCNGQHVETISYIQPSGFSTSYNTEPTFVVESRGSIPLQEPWINANAPATPFINPILGSYRSDNRGHIFFHSSGENRKGYALCLSCGYADSMNIDGTMPNQFTNHDRLRGKKLRLNGAHSNQCNPDLNVIQQNLHLGYSDHTDVFEVLLKRYDTNEYLNITEENKRLCWSLGVALRHGLAKSLGINNQELGIVVKQTRVAGENHPIYAICIFDSIGGGAGFASSAPQFLQSVFENALELLKCNASCSSVCENCLLQYDTNRQVDYLDRMIALSYLQDGFMDLLHLSKEYQFLGSDSFYCDASFEEERNNSAKLFNERITLFLKGDSAMWEIAVSSLKRKLHHIIDRFQNVELVLDQNSFDSLDYDGMKDLWNVMSFWPSKLKLFVSSKYPMLANKGHLLAILTKGLESRSYATSVDEAVNFGTEWGNTSEGILIRSDLYRVSFEPKEISLESLYKASLETIGNAFSINIKRELNGKATEFGKKFWAEMGQKIPTLQTMLRDKKIESVTYEDKYLTSPLTVMLMSNSIKYLHSALGKSFDVTIRTLEPDSRFSRNDEYLHKNYQFGEKSKQRDTISTLSNCGKEVDVILADYGGRTIKLQHARVMTIKFQNGEEVQIRFDQGFGYWRSKENIHFRFDITARQQSAFLLTGEDSRRGRSIMIVNDSDDYPTNITVLISKQQLSV